MFGRERDRSTRIRNVREEINSSLGLAKDKQKKPTNKTQDTRAEYIYGKGGYLDDFKILDELGVERSSRHYIPKKLDMGVRKYLLPEDNRINLTAPVSWHTQVPTAYLIKTEDGYKELMTNQYNFNNIKNIDEILIQMTKIMSASVDSPHIIDPDYAFSIKLTDKIEPAYIGSAKLVVYDDIRPENLIEKEAAGKEKLSDDDSLSKYTEVRKRYCENAFLDYFIGLGYGANVKQNKELREELEAYTNKLISKGRRIKLDTSFADRNIDGHNHWEVPGVIEKYDFPGK